LIKTNVATGVNAIFISQSSIIIPESKTLEHETQQGVSEQTEVQQKPSIA
jgi:hypothetical protein